MQFRIDLYIVIYRQNTQICISFVCSQSIRIVSKPFSRTCCSETVVFDWTRASIWKRFTISRLWLFVNDMFYGPFNWHCRTRQSREPWKRAYIYICGFNIFMYIYQNSARALCVDIHTSFTSACCVPHSNRGRLVRKAKFRLSDFEQIHNSCTSIHSQPDGGSKRDGQDHRRPQDVICTHAHTKTPRR